MDDPTKLRPGDRVRILAVPGEGIPGYTIFPETVRAYRKLIARGRSVRIARVDEYRQPWYDFRFRRKNGKLEYHSMVICESDANWVHVVRRTRSRKSRTRVNKEKESHGRK